MLERVAYVAAHHPTPAVAGYWGKVYKVLLLPMSEQFISQEGLEQLLEPAEEQAREHQRREVCARCPNTKD